MSEEKVPLKKSARLNERNVGKMLFEEDFFEQIKSLPSPEKHPTA